MRQRSTADKYLELSAAGRKEIENSMYNKTFAAYVRDSLLRCFLHWLERIRDCSFFMRYGDYWDFGGGGMRKKWLS